MHKAKAVSRGRGLNRYMGNSRAGSGFTGDTRGFPAALNL